MCKILKKFHCNHITIYDSLNKMLITKSFYRFILVAMQYRVYSRSLTVQGKFVCS